MSVSESSTQFEARQAMLEKWRSHDVDPAFPNANTSLSIIGANAGEAWSGRQASITLSSDFIFAVIAERLLNPIHSDCAAILLPGLREILSVADPQPDLRPALEAAESALLIGQNDAANLQSHLEVTCLPLGAGAARNIALKLQAALHIVRQALQPGPATADTLETEKPDLIDDAPYLPPMARDTARVAAEGKLDNYGEVRFCVKCKRLRWCHLLLTVNGVCDECIYQKEQQMAAEAGGLLAATGDVPHG